MSAKVHALVVNEAGDVQTRCGRGDDGTFCYRPREGRPTVRLTCKSCIRLVFGPPTEAREPSEPVGTVCGFDDSGQPTIEWTDAGVAEGDALYVAPVGEQRETLGQLGLRIAERLEVTLNEGMSALEIGHDLARLVREPIPTTGADE